MRRMRNKASRGSLERSHTRSRLVATLLGLALAVFGLTVGASPLLADRAVGQTPRADANLWLTLDADDFCCPDYAAAITDRIGRGWTFRPTERDTKAVIRFTITAGGGIVDIAVERPSGDPAFDLSAERAVMATPQLPPLPAAFPRSMLTAHLTFDAGNGTPAAALGANLKVDARGVDFEPWFREFVARVKRNWLVPFSALSYAGHSVLTFYVHKNGTITDVTVSERAFVDVFNSSASRAIFLSNPTAPLPADYPSEKAFFTVTFYYNEKPPDKRQ